MTSYKETKGGHGHTLWNRLYPESPLKNSLTGFFHTHPSGENISVSDRTRASDQDKKSRDDALRLMPHMQFYILTHLLIMEINSLIQILSNMKKQSIVIFLLIILVLFGFLSTTKIMGQTGVNIQERAIDNAILDFSKNCNLYKKDSIFSVSFKDSVFNEGILVRVDENSYKDKRTHEWKRGSLYDGIATVSITAHRIGEYCEECCDKFLYTKETTVGSKGKLPSRYIEKGGKLFYWWDDSYPLTEEMLAILWKYNLLCDDTEDRIGLPDFSTDDKLKGAHYYFCKSNLSKYKRMVTSIGLGYYKPPKLNCKK
ncbi:MAG: hypothetical protein LBR65_05055 [Culturomica sp.]|jgi:hypothetical protein|nr:hypothetical protein [Culturomica sp.]